MKSAPQEEKKEEEPTIERSEKKDPKVSMTLLLALVQRNHEKLSHPPELLKLRLKHKHMSTEQFKKQTFQL